MRIRSVTLTILLIVVVACALRFTRGLLFPIVLAVLVQFVLEPVVRMLRVVFIPAAIGAALVLLALVGVSAYGVYRGYEPAIQWAGTLPQKLRQVEHKLGFLRAPVEQVTRATEQVEDIAKLTHSPDDQIVRLERPSLAQVFFESLSDLASGSVLGLVLAYFLLASEGAFLHRIAALMTGASEQAIAGDGMRTIRGQISTYLFTITCINATLGLVVGVIMFATGMPNPVLWGVMAGVLTYVPYLGATVGVGIVTVVALVSFERVSDAIIPPLLYTVAAIVEGMIVTPMVLGYRLTLNPAAIFLWLVLWNWLWGIPGAVIAVPMLVVVKILCDNLPSMAPLGKLLER